MTQALYAHMNNKRKIKKKEYKRKNPFSLHPHQHLLLLVSLMIVILKGVRWNLGVIFTYISFMVKMLNISSCIYGPFVLLLKTGQFICPFIN
jgi:hypothetical protein